MRNLKRALSLTLASVMLLGMMVMGSSALSFNDADDISNVTAATVLEELGVMQGDGQGNFMPEQTVTRAQMAILICRILYGDRLNVRQFEGTTQYTDVGANDYYTGYINLATSLGIINGYGDGRFGPDDTVTTAQAALMLSRALGYFQANELEGQDWALAAVAQATKIDMFGNLKLATNEGLARDNVAEMVFNTMTAAVPVHYSERWDVYYTDTQSILAGVNFDYRNTLGYTNFDLVYSENKSDDFNRPATEWGTGTVVGSTDDKGNIVNANIKNSFIKAVNDVDATYTAKVKMSDIYKDLGLGEAVAASKVSTYRNGKSVASEDLSRSNETKIGGNGVLTQVWYDSDDKTATISMIDTFVGKVSTVNRATSSADRSVTISQFPVTGSLGSALDAKFETENFAAKDVVLYTAAWNGSKYEIQTMEALGSPVTGTLTKWVGTTVDVDTGKSESSLTVDSTTYKYDVNVVVADENDSQVAGVWSQFTVNESEINVYTDKYGYAIYVSGVEGEKNYAAVIGTGNTNPYGDETTGVTLLLPDGTRKAVTAKLKTGSQFADDQGNKGGSHGNQKVDDVIGDLVSYKIKDDGVYELTVLDNWTRKATDAEISSTIPAGAANMSAGVTCFTNGKSLIKLGGANYYVTDDTVFFVATDLDDVAYSVYVGYDAMPSFGNDSEHGSDLLEGYAFKTRNEYTTQLEAVYIAADALGGTSSVDTYFVKKADADIETDSTGSYYILPAIVDDAVTEIKLDATNIIAGIDWRNNGDDRTVGVFAIKNVTKDKNDIITNFALASDALNATDGGSKTGTVATARGVLGIGSTVAGSTVYWVYNNSTKAYRVNEDLDEITAIDVASIGTDTNDRVYAKADSDTKVLQDVIVVEVEDDSGSGNSGLNPADVHVQGSIADGFIVTTNKTANNFELAQAIEAYLREEGVSGVAKVTVANDAENPGQKIATITYVDDSTETADVATVAGEGAATAAKVMDEIQNAIMSATSAADKPNPTLVNVTVEGNTLKVEALAGKGAQYFSTSSGSPATHDLARFLGKLYTSAGAAEIKYTPTNGAEKTYTWEDDETVNTISGDSKSKWYNAGNGSGIVASTLVGAIINDFKPGNPASASGTITITVDGAPMNIAFSVATE